MLAYHPDDISTQCIWQMAPHIRSLLRLWHHLTHLRSKSARKCRQYTLCVEATHRNNQSTVRGVIWRRKQTVKAKKQNRCNRATAFTYSWSRQRVQKNSRASVRSSDCDERVYQSHASEARFHIAHQRFYTTYIVHGTPTCYINWEFHFLANHIYAKRERTHFPQRLPRVISIRNKQKTHKLSKPAELKPKNKNENPLAGSCSSANSFDMWGGGKVGVEFRFNFESIPEERTTNSTRTSATSKKTFAKFD